MTPLNHSTPYAIHWIMIQFDKPITEIMKRSLTNHGFLNEGTIAQRHCPSKERAEEMRAIMVEEMKLQGRSGRAFIITDKQFGLGTVVHNATVRVGTAEQLGGIQGVNGSWVSFFPATEMQIFQSVIF